MRLLELESKQKIAADKLKAQYNQNTSLFSPQRRNEHSQQDDQNTFSALSPRKVVSVLDDIITKDQQEPSDTNSVKHNLFSDSQKSNTPRRLKPLSQLADTKLATDINESDLRNTRAYVRRTDAAKQAIANFDRNQMQQKINYAPNLKQGSKNERNNKGSTKTISIRGRHDIDEERAAVNSQGSHREALIFKSEVSSQARVPDGIATKGEMNRNEFASLVMSSRRDELPREQNRGEKDLFREST